MTRGETLSADDALAAEAIRALGGLVCTGCGVELDRQQKQFVCPACGQVHCPFCERGISEGCQHRIAWHFVGDWHFPDVIPANYQGPCVPIAPPFLLDFSPEQKKAAFGSAAPSAEPLLKAGTNDQSRLAHVFQELVKQEAIDGPWYGAAPRPGAYYFARDPDTVRAEARQMLRDLETGFARLLHFRPPGTEFIHRVLTACDLMGWSEWGRSGRICFGQEGVPHLAYILYNHVLLWNTDRGDPLQQITHPDEEHVCSVRFSPDGTRIAVYTERFDCVSTQGTEEARTLWVWEIASGQLLKTRSNIRHNAAPPPYQLLPFFGRLHNGETQISALGATIEFMSLLPNANEKAAPESEADFVLRLREPITQVAVAPDGETFATAQERRIILWRVPREAVHGAEKEAT